ncbi:unnamed protein product [Vitrella brassicaformis CCMP3155]|uniref:Cyclin-dependent kinase 2 homolog n=1 Tax=Vitrella brassicaformis (strain CCMP3155) TaxID=1169540 RepID=A0A0G4EV90_VITBC|nr:unnamed protein product [Vitrella brassicaformis CCMP3155]|mmetsp:Transcript_18792/g.45238  ORF Transcript_18792/g.45238 Transcript_18792/m.45238 type:complete len:514 (-) Transcript_18792:331-1872(-)|eukprot:CEM02536.1 unnamed protein product [Vitrella brassicaformis CCMP3155]
MSDDVKMAEGAAADQGREALLTPEHHAGEADHPLLTPEHERQEHEQEQQQQQRNSSPSQQAQEPPAKRLRIAPDEIDNDQDDILPPSQPSPSPPTVPPQLSPPPPSVPRRVHDPLVHGCRSVNIFKKLNKIDEGTYGVVFRAQNTETGEIVALKQIKYHEKQEKEGFPITSLREISILLNMQHENIVDVKEVVVGKSPTHIFMVMEYMEHELKALLEDMKNSFSVAEVKALLLQLLRAVAYMHHHWILHRDLKTSNLLFNNQGVLKVCDFGLARKYGAPIRVYTHHVVTLWYRAPELLLGERQYTQAIDVWSVGCIFAEMILRTPIFPGKNEKDQIDNIFRLTGSPSESTWPGFGELPHIKAGRVKIKNIRPTWREKFPRASYTGGCSLTDTGLDLMIRLLDPNPKARITAAEALDHPYFKEAPKPQQAHLMPTYPETNASIRDKRKRMKSLDDEQIKEREAYHEGADRFGSRIDARQFLSDLAMMPARSAASKPTTAAAAAAGGPAAAPKDG